MTRLWVGGLALWLGACGTSGAPGHGIESTRQAVVGGGVEPGYPAVGAIVPVSPICDDSPQDAPVLCTGTLIAPRVVLTAAHCIERADAAQVLSVVFAPVASQAAAGERVRAVEGRLHPAWNAGDNDIGLLVLAEEAPVSPMDLGNPALPTDLVGQTVRVVGFGSDDQGQSGTRRSGVAAVTAVASGTFALAAAPGMSCGGDSGGPVFLEGAGGQSPSLIGITAYGDAACTVGTNTRVDAQLGYLAAQLGEIAGTPAPRPPLDPTIDACSVPCTDHADCPLGMACISGAAGGKRCAVAGLQVGRFGAACTGAGTDAQPCVKAGDTCRSWLPCPAATPSRGCAVAPRGAGTAHTRIDLVLWAAALAILGRRAFDCSTETVLDDSVPAGPRPMQRLREENHMSS